MQFHITKAFPTLQFIENTTFCTHAIVFCGSILLCCESKPDLLQLLIELWDTVTGEISKEGNALIHSNSSIGMHQEHVRKTVLK